MSERSRVFINVEGETDAGKEAYTLSVFDRALVLRYEGVSAATLKVALDACKADYLCDGPGPDFPEHAVREPRDYMRGRDPERRLDLLKEFGDSWGLATDLTVGEVRDALSLVFDTPSRTAGKAG